MSVQIGPEYANIWWPSLLFCQSTDQVVEIQDNDESTLTYTFPEPIPNMDEDGDTIYHRFKVTVENASGLMNTQERILTI